MEKYNVYLIGINNFKAKKQLAEEVDFEMSEQMELNTARYSKNYEDFIAGYEVGSEQDLEAKKQLNA